MICSQAITFSTPLTLPSLPSSPLSSSSWVSTLTSTDNLVEHFITLKYAKETLRQVNSLFLLEKILLISSYSSIHSDDDDSITDIII